MPDRKFGRIRPEILPHNDESILQFRAAKRIALKPAPQSVVWWKESLPRIMGFNDRAGTCGPVSYANFIKLCSAYTLGQPIVLSDGEIADIYRAMNPDWSPNGGQGDRGVVLSQLYDLMKTSGPRGVNLEDYFAVNPKEVNNVQWSVRIFGPNAFGVLLNDRDMKRTENGDPWVDVGQGDPRMGHAITVYDYDGYTWDAESWAQKQQFTTPWMLRRTEEVHGFIHPYQFRSTGLSFAGLDKKSMKVDAGLI